MKSCNPSYVGAFGTVFVDKSQRLNPNISDYALDILTKDIRERVEAPSAQHGREKESAKLFSSLYSVGPGSEIVQSRLKPKPRDYASSVSLPEANHMESVDPYVDPALRLPQTMHPPERPSHSTLRGTDAIYLNERLSSGPFYVPGVLEQPYEEPLQAHFGTSYQISTTPKMWPSTSMYPTSQFKESMLGKDPVTRGASVGCRKSGRAAMSPLPSDHRCSKISQHAGKYDEISVSLASTASRSAGDLHCGWPSVSTVVSSGSAKKLSGLQAALVQCGRLKVVYETEEAKSDKIVSSSLSNHKRLLHEHAGWLAGGFNGTGSSIASVSSAVQVPVSELQQLSSLTAHSSTDKPKRLYARADPKSGVTKKRPSGEGLEGAERASVTSMSAKSSHGSVASTNCHTLQGGYMSVVSDYMGSVNMSALNNNPFRVARNRPSLINSCKTPAACDPTQYRQEAKIQQRGNFSVCVSSSSDGLLQSRSKDKVLVPSREAITSSLAVLSRKALLRYDMKVVETGGLLKALEDMNHESPGVGAVLDLHRAMAAAAAFNPDPWALSRVQLSAVIEERVPWYPKEARSRLITAYDTGSSNLIRFIRLSTALLCGVHASALEIATAGIFKDSEDGFGLLIRCLHSLYEHGERGIFRGHDLRRWRIALDKVNGQAVEQRRDGMKLEDVMECLSCCCCSVDDETRIHHVVVPVIQEIFDKSQQMANSFEMGHKSSIAAADLLRHSELKSVKHIPKISWELLLDAMRSQSSAVSEFSLQVQRFRDVVRKYTLTGSIRFDVAQDGRRGYGTKLSKTNEMDTFSSSQSFNTSATLY